MSNYLALATVTATLSYVVQDALRGLDLGATVTTQRPDAAIDAVPNPKVNIFLFQSNPDEYFRNQDLPRRDARGLLINTPLKAVDLRYLLTFYGNDASLDSQIMMAATMARLHDEDILTPELIERAIASSSIDLSASNLATQPVFVRVWPKPLDYDQLNRLWSVFSHAPYNLSAAYEAGPVFLDEAAQPVVPVPVKTPRLTVTTFAHPTITNLKYVAGAQAADGGLLIEGEQLAVENARVRLRFDRDETLVAPDPGDIGPRAIMLRASAFSALRAGKMSTQVIGFSNDDPPLPLFASNVYTAPIAPAMNAIAADAGVVTVTLQLPAYPLQRATLALRQLDVRRGSSYALVADPRRDKTATLTFAAAAVAAGDYLAFLTIDGVGSTLDSPCHQVTIGGS